MEDLYNQGTYVTGTVRIHRLGMSHHLDETHVQKGQVVFEQKGPVLAAKWHDWKVVTLLSSYSDARSLLVTYTDLLRKTKLNENTALINIFSFLHLKPSY